MKNILNNVRPLLIGLLLLLKRDGGSGFGRIQSEAQHCSHDVGRSGMGRDGIQRSPSLENAESLDEMAGSGAATGSLLRPLRRSVRPLGPAFSPVVMQTDRGAFGAGWSIRPDEVTLAPILKAAGYREVGAGT